MASHMSSRKNRVSELTDIEVDVLIIGAGINGASAAAALSSRGFKTVLIDRGDFASETSSQSSNLVWGGIKYLESYDFLLVNKLCRSRNHLMKSYPAAIQEIRFLTTVKKGFRYPVWLIYLSTILYWVMGRFKTQRPKLYSAKSIVKHEAVLNTFEAAGAFEYSDCYLPDNDARFTFNLVRSAMDRGCKASNYMRAMRSERQGNLWVTQVEDMTSGAEFEVSSKVIINACGPWVDEYNRVTGQQTQYRHLYSKGIHLIVDKVSDSKRILTFFASDGRMFFVIPMGNRTCIGTTDTQLLNPESVVTSEDRQFVLKNINELLSLDQPITERDIISERCGVRPLAQKVTDTGDADWVRLSRKHVLEVDAKNQYVSVFGGKLTDCVNIGNEITSNLIKMGYSPKALAARWYGEPSCASKVAFLELFKSIKHVDQGITIDEHLQIGERLWRRYGDNAYWFIDFLGCYPESLEPIVTSAEYILAEAHYAAEFEMVTKLEDFLRRRTQLSLTVKLDDLLASGRLKLLCEILFKENASAMLEDYLLSKGVNGIAYSQIKNNKQ